MLITKDLVKIYKPKKGVPVTALNKISLTFPDKGMVFLLGKSGSGKSTLLNVLGGLDNYNSGEIIIKGVSSKNFKQQHFDSYRNTYVGFIFQEYNVLDEFSVGANIALAIELQNRKADEFEINNILKEVDLEGFGNRKPNELSGGQKQRVAIARALVKNPEIIMADEPTGALDSNTGKQVFDTLKKLSQNKLVIVVSHDREFAEQYADRIIELSDGNVLSDVEVDSDYVKEEATSLQYNDNIIEVPCGYHITEEDRKAINDYIEKVKNEEVKISISGKKTNDKHFISTDISKISVDDGSKFNLIKSKLPLKNAFKIGGSSLKFKKFRLVMTVLLSCISFGLFGLADTFGSYNHIKTCTNSMYDSNLNYLSVAKSKKVGKGVNQYWRNHGYYISKDEIKDISKNTNEEMTGVYKPTNVELSFESNVNKDTKFTESDYNIYHQTFEGFSEINKSKLDKLNFKILAGQIPDGTKDEIMVSNYIFEIFKKASYTDGSVKTDSNGKASFVYQDIKNYNDIIGKVLTLNNKKYTIVGVVDTGFDLSRYTSLTEKKENPTSAQKIIDYALYNEFSYATGYSLSNVIMVGDGYVDNLINNSPKNSEITDGYVWYGNDNTGIDSRYIAKLSNMTNQKIVWIDGEKSSLTDKEIVVSSDLFNQYVQNFDEENNETSELSENKETNYKELLKNKDNLSANIYLYGSSEDVNISGVKIVGVIDINENNIGLNSTVVTDDNTYKSLTSDDGGVYSFAVGKMPDEKGDINSIVSYCYREDSSVRYQLQNAVTYELDTVNDVLKTLSKWFFYIGLGFAVFASIMLANFIAMSISHKKQEIGILRAIGSRSNDVFRIFFSESFIIAMINFVLSSIGVFAATLIINYLIRKNLGILITVLSFGPRQIILLLAVSIVVAVLASFFPVKKIASKRPIDAIRNR